MYAFTIRCSTCLNHTTLPKIMDGSSTIFDFIHNQCLICARSPKITDRSYKIFNFPYNQCIICARSPMITDGSYKIFNFRYNRCIICARLPKIMHRTGIQYRYGHYNITVCIIRSLLYTLPMPDILVPAFVASGRQGMVSKAYIYILHFC